MEFPDIALNDVRIGGRSLHGIKRGKAACRRLGSVVGQPSAMVISPCPTSPRWLASLVRRATPTLSSSVRIVHLHHWASATSAAAVPMLPTMSSTSDSLTISGGMIRSVSGRLLAGSPGRHD